MRFLRTGSTSHRTRDNFRSRKSTTLTTLTEQPARPQLLDLGPPLARELRTQVRLPRTDVSRDGTSAQRATLTHPVIIHPAR
ncbi:hypothetical protein [Streptomyces cyaneofuscatus]|uniref:hypothetical protein n=1 Tax=Streptomyces cyaneofuscatus TaxID=66883 RepID=UPI003798E17F